MATDWIDDEELLQRLGDVLDRVDPMPPDVITTGRAVFTAGPTNPSAGQVPPCLPAEAKTAGPER